MENVLSHSASELLDEEKVYTYLVQVAPIKFSFPFNDLFDRELKKQNQEIQDAFKLIDTVEVSINDKVDIRKPYSENIEGSNDKVEGISFKLLKDSNTNKILAVCWYAVTKFSEQLKDKDGENKTIGLRLRLHNIQIGDKNFFNNYFKEARGNKYFNGEVHIIEYKIKPTTSRAGLQNSTQTTNLNYELKNFFRNELHKLYYKANKIKNAVKKHTEIVGEIIQQKNITKDFTDEQKQQQLKEKNKIKEKVMKDLNKLFEKKQNNPAENIMIDAYKKDFEIDKSNAEHIQVPVVDKENKTSEYETDFSELKKLYTQEEYEIIEIIFSAINTNFYQDSYKPTIDRVKKFIVDELKQNAKKTRTTY